MVDETKTSDSMRYDDVGERTVMLFGVNIAKKPTKVDETIKNINSIHGDDKNEISIFEQRKENENDDNSKSNHEKIKEEIEQRSENGENGNDNNKVPELAIVQRPNNERIPELAIAQRPNNERIPELAIAQRPNHERIKRVKSWTEMEHKAFLKGLKAVGKGRWKNISRNFVITKTPTQVASHAQKHFQRSEPIYYRTKRQSIFDMKLLEDEYENSKASSA